MKSKIDYEERYKKSKKFILTVALSFLILNILYQIVSGITSIIIGGIYLNECTIENRIPIWLLSFKLLCFLNTVLLITLFIILVVIAVKSSKVVLEVFIKMCFLMSFIEIILLLILLILIIIGSIWVFQVYKNVSYNKDSYDYCNQTLFQTAFSTIIIELFIYVTSISYIVFSTIYSNIIKTKKSQI